MPHHPIARVTSGLMRKLNECTEHIGLPSLLTASPFDNAEYASTGDNAAGAATNMILNNGSTMDMDLMNGLPNDFLFADFPAFDFQDSQFGFTS